MITLSHPPPSPFLLPLFPFPPWAIIRSNVAFFLLLLASVGVVQPVAGQGAQCDTLAWLYLQQGEIASASPSSGQTGSVVTILGQRLLGGGASVTNVLLAGTPVRQILSGNNTVVTVVADRASSATTGNIVIQADTGALVVKVRRNQLQPILFTRTHARAKRESGREGRANGKECTLS